MTQADNYDYDAELDDETDTLQFGKYAILTPAVLFQKDPHYLIWGWENTTRWVGSEALIRDAHKQCGVNFKPRNKILPQQDTEDVIAAFEQAVYDTWGCFPKPTYAR